MNPAHGSSDSGRTAHSTFGIPVQDNDLDLMSKISPHSARAELLRNAQLIIWEELPMAKKSAMECVDELLRDVKMNFKVLELTIPIRYAGDPSDLSRSD